MDEPQAPLTNERIDEIADSIMEPPDTSCAAEEDMDRRLLRRFARAVIRAALSTAPVQEVLTDEQIERGRRETFSTENPFCPCDSKTMRKAVRWAERAHGIGLRAALSTHPPAVQPVAPAELHREECDDDDDAAAVEAARDGVSEHCRSVRNRIYEFRKRRDRAALASAPHPPSNTLGDAASGPGSTSLRSSDPYRGEARPGFDDLPVDYEVN